MSFETPILFCTYNRPELTERVFETIARQQPRHLMLSSDGHREEVAGDAELVEKTREILRRIDWPCDVQTRFSSTNLGCRAQMASSISWAFEQHDRIIILEDDCLPDDSFFQFCQQLLERYENDPRVMMISGDNFQPHARSEFSYYFSKYSHIWGWATWRRAWSNFDLEIRQWPDLKQNGWLNRWTASPEEFHYWTTIFDSQHGNQIDTWDYSWAFACWAHNGWTILPEVNLVSNIGFGERATHTGDAQHPLANLPVGRIEEFYHPSVVARDTVADEYTWHNVFYPAASSLFGEQTPALAASQ